MRKVFVHLAFWVTFYFVWTFFLNGQSLSFHKTWTVQFCYLIFVAANFYLHEIVLIPKYLHKAKYGWYAAFSIIGVLAASFLRWPLVVFMNNHVFIPVTALPDYKEILFDSLLNIGIWVLIVVSFRLVTERFDLQQTIKKIQNEKMRAEIDFLNAQFNPHFLFNSINSIYGQINKENPEARKMLLRFSDMLRYQLYECNTKRIAVEKEMNYLQNYVSMQRARMEKNFQVSLGISDNVHGFYIAPLLFIGFIENAFKYVSGSEDRDGFIRVELDRKGKMLIFFCVNSKGDQMRPSILHKGIGIQNVKKRLELLYPGRHELNLVENDLFYEVTLKIQIDEIELPRS